MSITLRRLLATALALLAPIGVLIGYLGRGSSVPDPLPSHWNINGVVDGTAGSQAFFVTALVISAVLAAGVAGAVWLAHSPMASRMLASLLAFGAWLAAAICLATLIASSGASAAQDVAMPWYTIVVFVLVPALLGVGMWALLPGWGPASAPSVPSSSITLAPGERVVWIGHEHSTLMRVLPVVLAIVGAVLLRLQATVSIPLFMVAVAVAMFSELAVRVDDRGVHILWGPFGWPRSRIPLADITAARSDIIEPLAWGGWGFRVSRRGVAAVIRRGPGLVIERSNKPTYAVTVAGADRGADVLNALLARQHAARQDSGDGQRR
jgi:hypothetical protein